MRDYNGLFASAIFQVPLAQNNPYANVAYFGVAYSATRQIPYTTVMQISDIKSPRHLVHSRCSQ